MARPSFPPQFFWVWKQAYLVCRVRQVTADKGKSEVSLNSIRFPESLYTDLYIVPCKLLAFFTIHFTNLCLIHATNLARYTLFFFSSYDNCQQLLPSLPTFSEIHPASNLIQMSCGLGSKIISISLLAHYACLGGREWLNIIFEKYLGTIREDES